jgi:hypothetical protein
VVVSISFLIMLVLCYWCEVLLGGNKVALVMPLEEQRCDG